MRVLVVHNRYSSRVPSGENLAVDDEVRWLREAGVDVVTHEVSNDEVFASGAVARARQAAESVWSPSSGGRMAAAIEHLEPDLVHVHNLFPLLTASVPWTAMRRRLPVVWTVHNHRVTCVAGTHFRDARPCHLCRPGWRLPGIRYACYADSTVASGLVTMATSVFGRMARGRMTAVAISNYVRDRLVGEAGFDAERVQTKYNGVASPPEDLQIRPAAAGRALLFAGHLTDHKGVSLLLESWHRAALPQAAALVIAGDGPRADDVRAAAIADSRISWLGQLSAHQLAGHLATARAVIVPSTWDEPFGRTAAEALAFGRPVITTGSGGLREIVDPGTGWITGIEPDQLTRAIAEAFASDPAVEERSRAARERHLRLFSPRATTDALLRIYDDALDRRGMRAPVDRQGA